MEIFPGHSSEKWRPSRVIGQKNREIPGHIVHSFTRNYSEIRPHPTSENGLPVLYHKSGILLMKTIMDDY